MMSSEDTSASAASRTNLLSLLKGPAILPLKLSHPANASLETQPMRLRIAHASQSRESSTISLVASPLIAQIAGALTLQQMERQSSSAIAAQTGQSSQLDNLHAILPLRHLSNVIAD
jgi:hypothetical protein